MKAELIKLSKFISLVLRHDPGGHGLTLDEHGWVAMADLVAAARRANLQLDGAKLAQIMAESDKQRFALSDDGLRIRANHGHSVPVTLPLEPTSPPDTLYHGTATRFLDSIKQQGLQPQSRQYVHLSADEVTARQVGQRHGKVVILTVQAGRMAADGLAFYQTASGIWLTAQVPPLYCCILNVSK